MPPDRLADPTRYDPSQPKHGQDAIRAHNPHRHEFELLHGVLAFDADEELIVGVHHCREDAFWVRGHIPGRPLMPGVLMVELAAQLCSFYWHEAFPTVEKFFGFGGIEETRFRGVVQPPCDLVVIGRPVQIKARRAIFNVQGFVGDTMVFGTTIKGMAI